MATKPKSTKQTQGNKTIKQVKPWQHCTTNCLRKRSKWRTKKKKKEVNVHGYLLQVIQIFENVHEYLDNSGKINF